MLPQSWRSSRCRRTVDLADLAQRTHSGMNRAPRNVELGSHRDRTSTWCLEASIGLHELWGRADDGDEASRLLVLHASGMCRGVLRTGRRGRARRQQGGRPVPPAPAPGSSRAPSLARRPATRTTHSDRSVWREGNRPSARGPKGTSSRIARLEAELDAALADEADPARRRKLVDDHNAKLRRLNIRFRGRRSGGREIELVQLEQRVDGIAVR